MTKGAWTCRQQDDGSKIRFAPREDEKPLVTDSERAQRWRLSLASLLFITVLLSDHLWFCAEAKLTRTRDKRLEHGAHILSSSHQTEQSLIFLGNSTKPLWRLETCHPDSLSKNCLTFVEAEAVCSGLSEWNLSDFYLSFCNSYSLLDLFYGFASPDNLTCSLDMADASGCSRCVQAYQRYDRRAQEKYREFELMVQKYEMDVYSVRTCMEECTVGPRCFFPLLGLGTAYGSKQTRLVCLDAVISFVSRLRKKKPLVHGPLQGCESAGASVIGGNYLSVEGQSEGNHCRGKEDVEQKIQRLVDVKGAQVFLFEYARFLSQGKHQFSLTFPGRADGEVEAGYETSLALRLICHSVSLELAYHLEPWGLFDTAPRLSRKPEDNAKNHDFILVALRGPGMCSGPIGHLCDRRFPCLEHL
ncbi:hypothetical protein DNTS_008869 [Danionella cerebrum]|uniref:Transmembrane protein FAM155A n=1 Tax=Danionella cerebrum TaxID=2873325 RepID=A0A553RMP8_9TELE|nr:hypothetical protein DNTS_008869 [Danionella translucida]